VHVGRDTVRLNLQITSPRRAADKLKFLAGSEAAMGAWIGDVPRDRRRPAAIRHRRSPAVTTTATPRTDAHDLFGELTGAAPVGYWSAPGRVNLIGEHTDYNDGFVFPFAIDGRTIAALGTRDDGRIRVVSTFDPVPVEVALADLDALFPDHRDEIVEWARYPLGVAWALRDAARAAGRDADALTGVDIALASDVPVGAGLSSSAAIEAPRHRLSTTYGSSPSPVDLAQAGRRAENLAVGAPTGIMDQMASMLGRADAGIFLDCRSLEADVVPLGFADAGLEVLVIDTRVSHAHSTGGYGERREACERGAQIMGVAALRDLVPPT
jgi:galactokinase